MTKKEKRFYKMAREASFMSDFRIARVGAVVVQGNCILSVGHNSTKTRPLQHRYNIYRHFQNYDESVPRQHAEIDALSPLIGKEINWSKVSIFIYRELRDGTPACSRPCEACMRLIKDLGIRDVYFIDENGRYVYEHVIKEN
jgi:deoxycytidylate deaminase